MGQNSRLINRSGFDNERKCVMAFSSEPCTESGSSGNRLTKGDGKCNLCGGSGVDMGVAVLAGYEGDGSVAGIAFERLFSSGSECVSIILPCTLNRPS
jgi:hypothetical protein